MKRYQTNAIVQWDPSITNCSVNDEIEKINVCWARCFQTPYKLWHWARSLSRLNTLNLFWARWSCGARSSVTEILISLYGKLFEQSFELNSTHFYFALFFSVSVHALTTPEWGTASARNELSARKILRAPLTASLVDVLRWEKWNKFDWSLWLISIRCIFLPNRFARPTSRNQIIGRNMCKLELKLISFGTFC